MVFITVKAMLSVNGLYLMMGTDFFSSVISSFLNGGTNPLNDTTPPNGVFDLKNVSSATQAP